MFNTTVKLKKATWQRVKRCSEAAGYSSPEEFVEHVLEKELARQESEVSEQEVERRLKGLGYLE